MKIIVSFFLSFIATTSYSQQIIPSQLFEQFKQNQATSVLPDFSYAGYQNGEQSFGAAYKNYPVFNILNYGAIANDGISDRTAIEAAIAAAKANGSGIVFFPPGRFIVNDNPNATIGIVTKANNIILKGSGSGPGGTELFMKNYLQPADTTKYWTCPPMFNFAASGGDLNIGVVSNMANKGDTKLTLSSVTGLQVGNWIAVRLLDNTPALVSQELAPYSADPAWTDITNGGISIVMYFKIINIQGNDVFLHAPIPYNVDVTYQWNVFRFAHSKEVGIEDIAFVGNFKKAFVHHGSWEDDSGYTLFEFSRCTDSWIKNCRFTDCSVGTQVTQSANITIANCTVTGNGGHEAITSVASMNILLAGLKDEASQWHSFGTNNGAMNTVVWRCTYPSTTCFESHASQPRNTLLDNVTGGLLQNRAGGDIKNMPNHLKGLVFWNYKQTNAAQTNFEFWSSSNQYWKFSPPVIAGYLSNGTTFKTSQLAALEGLNKLVTPPSLYEAQLALRLQTLPAWLQQMKDQAVLAVLRIGGVNGANGLSGSATPASLGTPVHIDKYSINSSDELSYISSTDLQASAGDKIFQSPSLNEGYLTRSENGHWLSFMGYASTSPVGTTVYNATLNPTIARTIGVMKHDGTANLSTALSNFPISGTAATVEGAVTTNGTDLWCVTNGGTADMGVLFTQNGTTNAAASPSVIVSNSMANNKSLGIFGGDLYYVNGSGGIGKVRASGGLPQTAGNTMTPLTVASGSTAFSTFTPSQIVMLDMEPSVLGYDVMYIANISTSVPSLTEAGIYKYCKNSAGEWVSYGSFGSINVDGRYFGITGEVVNGLPILYITRGVTTTTTVNTNQLIKVRDAAAYNATMNGTVTSTIGALVSEIGGTLRGVAFYPVANFYYKGTGNLNALASWGINTDGTGTQPASFTIDNQTFIIRDGSSATFSSNLIISGKGSKLVLGNGTTTTSLTIPTAYSLIADVDVYDKATLNIANPIIPNLHYLADGSTVSYASSVQQTVSNMAYGNFSNTNTAFVSVNGTVTVEGTIFQSGKLKGNATIVVPNGITNSGTIAPGNNIGSFNVTGNFMNSSNGIVAIELGGVTTPGIDYDQLSVSGNATLNGTLDLSLINGFFPVIGQTFTILTASLVNGNFSNVNWPAGITGSIVYNPTSIQVTISSMLVPLKLLDFSGSLLPENKIHLQWKTANENNTDHFEIESSSNNQMFKKIDIKQAIGVGNNIYNHNLNNIESVRQYYRLKVVDNNGEYYYSSVITIKTNTKYSGILTIFPNPANNTITIFHDKAGIGAYLKLMSFDGKVVLSAKVVQGSLQTIFNVSEILPATYILTFENEGTTISQKLIRI